MFFKLVFKSLKKTKRSSGLIILTTALGIALSISMIGIMLGINDKMNQELKSYGANIQIIPKDTAIITDLYGNTRTGNSLDYFEEADLPKIKETFWGFNIVDFTPYLDLSVTLDNDDIPIPMQGTWFNKHFSLDSGEKFDTGIEPLKKWWDIEGKWISTHDTQSVMVGRLLANQHHWKVGDKIKVKTKHKEKDLNIVGIMDTGDEDDQRLLVNLPLAQELANQKGHVNRADVSALTTPDNELARRAARNPKALTVKEMETWYCTAYVGSIAYQIQEAIPTVIAKPVRKIAESEGSILKKTHLLLIFISILALIGAILGTANLISANIIERQREIGLRKALGASNLHLVLSFLAEIFFINLIGAVIGLVFGYVLMQFIGWSIFNSFIPFNPWTFLIAIGLALVVTVGGLLPTIQYLLKLDPVTILHGR